ncbi:T6SS immunity protein Tli4 family protein [Lelliottia wanjuensis]|nr:MULTISPECIES: T6SS immunity protein Tli4 family protein [unclassified Lelliottia]MDK9355728.1 T6SS immunity protein Tli4 family protein [Lelliottia sp. V106_16]
MKEINKLTSRCIGRYLIDMPDDFKQTDGIVMIDGKQIESQKMYLPAFEQKISLREKELREIKPVNVDDGPFLKKTYPLQGGMIGVIFERTSSEISPDAFRNLEGYVYNNGVAFKIIVDAVNADGDRYNNQRNKDPDVYYNDISSKVSNLNNFLGRLHGRIESEVPTGKGFCIPHGFISGDGSEKEEVRFSYQSHDHPNLYFNIESDNFLREDSSMLERGGEIYSFLTKNKIKTISKGDRNINGMNAEEWLSVGNGLEVTSGHNFILNLHEKSGSQQTPFLRLNLIHGPLTDDNLPQGSVINLWQVITDTVRIRSSQF